MDKIERRRLIRHIIASKPVATQEELVEALKKDGLSVTQATISRDIAELGLVRVRDLEGRSVYSLPGQSVGMPLERLTRTMLEFGVGVDSSANLVVVRTTPGAAQTVARAIDESSMVEILGTIAGDDTILIVARDPECGGRVEQLFRNLRA